MAEGPFLFSVLQFHNVNGLFSFWALLNIEFNFLAVIKRFITITLNGCMMNKHIFAGFGGNKPVTFLIGKPFYFSFRHVSNSSFPHELVVESAILVTIRRKLHSFIAEADNKKAVWQFNASFALRPHVMYSLYSPYSLPTVLNIYHIRRLSTNILCMFQFNLASNDHQD